MTNELYHIHITSRRKWTDLRLDEVWRYRDLIWLMTKRSFTVSYKQTILGPAWLIINPLLSSIVYSVVFGRIAGLSTEGLPRLLFYLTGSAIWAFFSTCLTGNAGVFVNNASLFGKVYFPRLAVPVANVLSAVIRFLIQLLLVLLVFLFYLLRGQVQLHPAGWLLIPVILLQLGLMGMGCGIIVSSLTTKYRDLSVLVSFFTSLWMYATPVVYPLSQVTETGLQKLMLLNPVTAPVELFRRAVLGVGTVEPLALIWSWAFTILVLVIGVLLFNRIEKNFMDTV